MNRLGEWWRNPWAWSILAVLLGLALRLYHFLRVPAVWHDEAALLVNVVNLDYAEQLGPLLWHEAAPPLFLWLERTIFLTLGEAILVLRLVPFLASCAALLLLVPVCRMVLPTGLVPVALGLFACSEQLLWHACEAKPYAVDAFLGVFLLWLWCKGQRWDLTRQLLVLSLLAPILISLSYPACFLLGGLLLAHLPRVWRDRRLEAGLAYVLAGSATLATFAALALGPARAQRDGAMLSCWLSFFPDWSRPWSVPGWMVVQSLELFRHCFRPIGQPLLLLAILGWLLLARRGRWQLLTLLAAPVLLALLAALLGRYPYGGARVMMFAMPALVLLTASGVQFLSLLSPVGGRTGREGLSFPLLVLVLLPPLVASFRSVLSPWPRPEADRAFAWVEQQRTASDIVVSNSWTLQYYFRSLGEQSRELPVSADPGVDRIWLAWSDQAPPGQLFRDAEAQVPPGWQIVRRQAFRWLVVLELRPRSAVSVAASR